MATIDRAGIAERLRGLFGGQDNGDIAQTAARLGVEELSLRMSIDDQSPHPTVEVLAAVINAYGVDPRWLMTGQYDPVSHRSAMESADVERSVRELLESRDVRISQPTSEPLRYFGQN